MTNTYTQIYLQFIFAVQNRRSLILPEWESRLHKYITGIVQNKSHKMVFQNCSFNLFDVISRYEFGK